MNRHFYSAIQTTGIDLDKIMLLSRFGGGGHSMAAGVRIRGPIEEVRLTILKAMREEVERVLRQKIS